MTDQAPAPLRIKEFRAENFKKLVVVAIRPDKSLVEITGRNGNGKTSVLDGIWVALTGLGAAPPVLIRKGEEKCTLHLDMGSLIVTRTFNLKEDGGYTHNVTVRSDEGAKFTAPQAVLDAVLGKMAMDPLEFIRMKPKDKVDVVKVLVPGVDFADIAKRRLDAFTTRTAKKGKAEDLRAQANGIVLPPGKVPVASDLKTLEDQLAKAADHNTLVERRRNNRKAASDRLDELRADKNVLEQKLMVVEKQIADLAEQIDTAAPLDEPIDTAKVQADLQAARAGNAIASEAARRRGLELMAEAAEADVARLTSEVKACDDERAKAVAKAKMPIAGLDFSEDGVLLNGLPLEQASDAEQLRTSIAIAGAMNPRLRVIRVRDGSLLDDAAMKLLATYAEEHDLQIWVERVDDSGVVGFVLEDGYVKGSPEALEAAAEAEPEAEELV